jgi:hypothetical protein
MIVYWLLFLVPVIGLLSKIRVNSTRSSALWRFCAVAFTCVIGLRSEVGGDWFNYQRAFDAVRRADFVQALNYGDPGYYGLSWVVARAGGDIYVLNTACAIVAVAGLLAFARRQPLPWLALLVAVPYLVLVVDMGYTRQAVALGFAMFGLSALGEQRISAFVLWIFAAALFHKSAVLLFPIAALASTRRRVWTWTWVGITTLVGGSLFLFDTTEQLWQNYVAADIQSGGGLVRVLMNAIPAALLLLYWRRVNVAQGERKLWFWLSIFSIACVPLVFISSTATDRVALYFIPIQMYLFPRLISLPATDSARAVTTEAVVLYYAVVMLVWLNFAANAHEWVPYHFKPLRGRRGR